MNEYRSALSAQLIAAQAEHARRQNRLDKAEREFEEAPDEERRNRASERDSCARRSYVSQKAVRELEEAMASFSSLSSRFTEATNRLRLRANQRLTFLDEALAVYAFAATSDLRTGSSGDSNGGRESSSGASPLGQFLLGRGMRLIAVDAADFTDNPILSWKTDVADYMWACEKWDTVVSRTIAQGQGRDELAKRDASSGAEPTSMRQLAHVWDFFLGGDPIRVDARANGSFEVISGRHRLEVAKQLGIQYLPAVVGGEGK